MPKQESTGRSSYPNTRSTGRLHNIEEKKQQEKQENSQVHNIDGFKFLGQSLKVQTGYLNQVSHGCLLPYIVLTPLKDGTPLKFLIDTGATMSFIDPLIIPQNDQKNSIPLFQLKQY